jgi:type I restriction enzyme R subunit
MTTDTTERGLEDLICIVMTGGRVSVSPLPIEGFLSPPEPYGGTGWYLGDARDYDRDCCVDLVYLRAFLTATQPEIATALELDRDTPVRRKFLARLEKECGTPRGISGYCLSLTSWACPAGLLGSTKIHS